MPLERYDRGRLPRGPAFAGLAAWLAASLIVLIPAVVAFDYGGILHWTQLVASYAVFVVLICATVWVAFAPNAHVLVARFRSPSNVVFLVLAGWVLGVWAQSVDTKPQLATVLSPQAARASTQWLKPVQPKPARGNGEAKVRSVPLSVLPDATLHAAAWVCVLLAFYWGSATVMSDSQRAGLVLAAIAVVVSFQAIYGLWDVWLTAKQSVWVKQPMPRLSFGNFVNRNNAGLYLNLGLGASLGCVLWRYSTLRLHDVREVRLNRHALDYLKEDWIFWVAAVSGLISATAILVCGSVVALAGSVGGLLFSIRAFQKRWVVASSAALVALVFCFLVGVAFLLERPSEGMDAGIVGLSHRFMSSVLPVRWPHWIDGFETGINALPLGAGTGSYAYAYLPFQSRGVGLWFNHADNLWLELFVEQGVWGSVFAVVLLAYLLLATTKLARSETPLDRGVLTAFQFGTGAVVASQLFDFGLILPANSCLFLVLVSLAVCRATFDSQSCGTKGGTASRRWVTVAIGVTLTWALIAAIGVLHKDASEESVRVNAQRALQEARFDADLLESISESLQRELDSGGMHGTYLVQSKVLHQRARLREVQELTGEDARRDLPAYRQTSFESRRLRRDDSDGEKHADSNSLYRSARGFAVEALERCPLDFESRFALVYLDFVPPHSQGSAQLLDQLSQLQARNPEQLDRIARLAEQSGELLVAANARFTACRLEPKMTVPNVMFALRHPAVELAEQIPLTGQCQMNAARYLIDHPEVAESFAAETGVFLEQSLKHIDCRQYGRRSDQSNCELVLAEVNQKLNRSAAAIEHFNNAVRLDPADAGKRVLYVRALLAAGRTAEATEAASDGKRDFPNDLRFSKLLQTFTNP